MKSPKKRASPLFTSKGIERAQSKLPPPPPFTSHLAFRRFVELDRSLLQKLEEADRLVQAAAAGPPGVVESKRNSLSIVQKHRPRTPNPTLGPNDLLPRRRRRPRIFERRGRCPQRCSFLKLIVTRLLDLCSSRGSVDPKAGRSSRNDCSARTCVKFTTTQRSQVSLGPELSASRRRGAKGSKGKGRARERKATVQTKGRARARSGPQRFPRSHF